MSEAKFAAGFFVKDPHPNSPDFVKCKVSIKIEDFVEWLQGIDGDWLNLDVKRSKEGKLYAQVDEWKPSGGSKSDDIGEDVPF